MIYEYQCKFCPEPYEVVKSINRLPVEELCPKCWSVMGRRFSFQGRMGFGTFQEGHYHAFGKAFTSKHQLKEEISRIKGETGKEIFEVGNDTSGFEKPKQPTGHIKQAKRELRKLWRTT